MKIQSMSVLLASLLGGLSAPTLPAATPVEAPARAVQVSVVEQNHRVVAELGSTEFTVRRLLGEPFRKLNAEDWPR
jgi:hypothetical protein